MNVSEAIEKLTSIVERQDENSLAIANALSNVALALNRLADKETIHPQNSSVVDEFEEILKRKMADLGVSQALGHGTNMGHDSPRPKTAADKVREYLAENPQDRSLSVRELAEKIGVGKSTVSRIINGE
jgi:ribosome-binding protein aMBF1 (putative translation factor)